LINFLSFDIFAKTLKQGISITGDQISQLDINHFIYHISDGTVNYKGTMNDIHLQYFPIEPNGFNAEIFDFLSSKKNASLLYKKIEKVKNEYNHQIFQKIKKMKWSDKATLMFWDYQYQLNHFTLERIRYIKKNNDSSIGEYEKYIHQIESLSSKLFTNIGCNEQLQIEATPGSKYYQTKALSLLIKYQNNHLGILRFKFLNKSTSFNDQGKLVSLLYTLSYIAFNYEHNKLQFNLKHIFSASQVSFFKELVNEFSEIDQITVFREPSIGKVFEKSQYQYSPNYFFMHTLHSKEGIDISRGDLIEKSVLIREQEIAFNHLYNDHDTFNPKICYFNFIEYMLNTEHHFIQIPLNLFELILDSINEYFFESIIDQQIRMVNMIENQVKHSFTKNIKSCYLSNLEIAEKKLEQLKKDNTKKGPYRIKNKDYIQKYSCIKQWINILKENGRIDSGGGFFYNLINKDDFCSQYIIDEFSSMIPWLNWKDELYHSKALIKEKITPLLYKQYKYDLNILLESIFSNKSFLYNYDVSNRAVFYEAIEKQFDTYAKWEKEQRKSKKEYSVHQILKTSIKKRGSSFLKSWFAESKHI